MPIHNTNYRAWDGRRTSEWTRWWTICSTDIVRAYKSNWLKRLLLAAFLPLLFFAVPFFIFEQSSRDPLTWQTARQILGRQIPSNDLRRSIRNLPANPTPEQFYELRHLVWSNFMLMMLRYPQSLLMILVVGIVAPPLISQDLRTRAYLIYFSRPITRSEYIVGKFGVVSATLLCITVVPTMLLYLCGLMLSPSFEVFFATWDLPLRILIAATCLIVPTSLVALAMSSMTLESRYAGFAWFAMWIMGHVSYSALTAIPVMQSPNGEFDPGWRLLTSPYQVLGIVQSYIFDVEYHPDMVPHAFLMLIGVSALSLVVLFRRVNAPMRA
jgi:ABC-2 type transport system permease protein